MGIIGIIGSAEESGTSRMAVGVANDVLACGQDRRAIDQPGRRGLIDLGENQRECTGLLIPGDKCGSLVGKESRNHADMRSKISWGMNPERSSALGMPMLP